MEIRVDKDLYTRDVLLKTAYGFTDRAYIHLSHDDNSWIISWTDMPDSHISPLQFENELISQQLRAQILDKTSDIRKILLARAFASSSLDVSSITTSISDANKQVVSAQDDYSNDEEAANILKGWFDQ